MSLGFAVHSYYQRQREQEEAARPKQQAAPPAAKPPSSQASMSRPETTVTEDLISVARFLSRKASAGATWVEAALAEKPK